jgi:hypothetical protein
MWFRHRNILCLALGLASLSAPGSHPAVAQDSSTSSLQDDSAYQLSDPAELRRLSNAPYVGVKIRTTIPQRFEMYDPHSEQALTDLKAMGFTQVILDRPQLHKAATAAGLHVVLANWWTQDTKPDEIENGVERAREVAPEKLIGLSVMDEPGRNSPDTPFGFYIDLYEKLKPTFAADLPGTRLEISHWGPMAGWDHRYYDYFSFLYEAADVMRIMPYPDLNEAPLDDVFFMIQRSRRLMQIAERELPLVVILQAWLLPPDGTLPEIEELRVMAWQAMLSGAETLSFFEYNREIWDRTPGFHEQFVLLMAELTDLSERHKSATVVTEISVNGLLTSTLSSPTGNLTRIVVNTRRHAVGTMQPLEIREFTLHPEPTCWPALAGASAARCRVPCQRACDRPAGTSVWCNAPQRFRCQPQRFHRCR